MEFLVLRRGEKLGPFDALKAREMARAGELKAGDLVYYDGADGWVPLGHFLEAVARAEKGQDEAEPGEPVDASVKSDGASGSSAPAAVEKGTLPGESHFSGEKARHVDTSEEREIVKGGRYLEFDYCWSLLVVTFRRKARPALMRADGNGVFWRALGCSAVSALFGWWGFPLGPIQTISTLRHNARGGRDVTLEALTARVGHARAAAACARHKSSPPLNPWMRSLGNISAALSLMCLLTVGWAGYGFFQGEIDPGVAGPGAKEFEAANQKLTLAMDNTVYGNTPRAIELSLSFSSAFKDYYDEQLLDQVQARAKNTNAVSFVTFCELHQDRCVFLIRVPMLKQMSGRQKEALGENAWRVALKTITDARAGFSGQKVTVGIRGYSPVYHQVIMGDYVRDYTPAETGVRSSSTGPKSKLKLFPLFAPEEQLKAHGE